LAVQNKREWRRFCGEVLRHAELADDARFASNTQRVANRDQLEAELGAIFLMETATELLARLDRAQIANASLTNVQDLWEHPELTTRGRLREVASSAGPLRALVPPIGLVGVEAAMGAIPDVGEHAAAVLEELGYSEAEVAHLACEGAI